MARLVSPPMTRRRWIADEVQGNRAFLTGSHAGHLARVLRVRVGQQFEVSAGGKAFRGTVASVNEHSVEFDLGEELPEIPSEPKITVALAIFKFDRMEWALEKCTELGVSRIVPVISRRTDTYLAAASAKRVERWIRITRQASEQSRRAAPPEIAPPLKLKDAIALRGSLRIVLSESEKEVLLRDVLDQASAAADLVLAIGPEGGWTEEELKLFRDTDWITASLGRNILRAETAAIAALVLAVSCLS
jgi:16S rRNA (uracil1498-N3)-methyltransferase